MLDKLTSLDWTISHALNGSTSLFADGLAYTATATLTWIPAGIVLLYLVVHNNDLRRSLLILMGMALCILLADQVASGICKPLVARFRPTSDPELMGLVDIVRGYRGGQYGFFSSHAANTFSVAVYFALLVRSRRLSLLLLSWAALNGWTRIYLGVHYFGDVLVGTIWGIIVGCIVYAALARFVRRGGGEEESLSHHDVQTVSGYAAVDVYALEASLLLTYLFVVYRAVTFAQ